MARTNKQVTKRKQSNTVTGQTEMARALRTGIQSPIGLSDDEMGLFNDIIEALPYDSWDKFRIRIAATLAKLTIRMEKLMDELDAEGLVAESKRGTPVTNPKQAALMQVTGMVQRITNTLGLSASQRGVSEGKTGEKKKAEKGLRQTLDDLDDSEGLLAN